MLFSHYKNPLILIGHGIFVSISLGKRIQILVSQVPGKTRPSPPKPAGPLTGHCVVHAASVILMTPIWEAAWSVFPHLPTQTTTLARRWDDKSPCLAIERMDVWEGEEVPAGRLPRLALREWHHLYVHHVVSDKWACRFLGGGCPVFLGTCGADVKY